MSAHESSNEESVFAEALALPESERAAFLDRACGGDAALRAAVDSLLRAHSAAEDFLPSMGQSPLPSSDTGRGRVMSLAFAHNESEGSRIGRYKLLQKIGEGGCGVVYLAEQEEPVRRRVALKIIKLGMDTKTVVARFEAERQALAMMDHPNIAKVLDAGTTDSGRPFFVMDLVRGLPVTKYCDDNALSTKARLSLFCQICQAVQHAHQKGIVHRDIKPSNILVTLHDGIPVPKVIDFGIAKATQGKLTEHTLFTAFEQFIGTPAYMSPEQAEMSALDIDTRSDVYSLGVLLYELLTGRPPFDPKTFLAAGLDEMRRFIRETDPPKPSARLSTLTDADRTTVAKLRGTAPAQLSTVLMGDLDWIVMRCLEKDRTRRYDTAAALAADVQRHLSNEPVAARPPSSSYRLRKFCRRHKAGVFAAAAITLALVAGLIVSSALFVSERAARHRANAAEQAEGRLRQQAEDARTEEVKRAARTALDLANRNLADGHVADGLAYLVYAARKDPPNHTLGPRIASVLASHNFLIPKAAPLHCGSRVLAARFARDGGSFFVGTEDGTFRVMDAATGAVKRQFQTGREVVPDGWEFARFNDTVVGARFEDNTFALYDVATGAQKFPPFQLDPRAGLPESNRVVGLSPKGRWIYAVARGRFWLWHADSGALQLQLEFDDVMQGCDFSQEEDALAIIVGLTVARWSLPDGNPIGEPIPFRRLSPMPFGREVRFSPDGRRLAVIETTAVQILDALTGEPLQQSHGIDGELDPRVAAFVTNDLLLLQSETQFGWLDISDGKFAPSGLPRAINVSLDATGRRGVATSLDGLVRVFDVGSVAPVVEPSWRQSAAFCAAVSPDGHQVILGTADGLLYRFNVGRGAARPLVTARAPEPWLPAMFAPDSPSRVMVLTGESIKTIDAASGRELASFPLPEPVRDYAVFDTNPPIRSDLKFLVVRTAEAGELQSWELGAGGILRVTPLQGATRGPVMFTFAPGDDVVALGSELPPRVWNLRTGAPVGPPVKFPGLPVPFSVSFSPDARRLAMGGRDGSALVFDVATGLPLRSLKTRRQVRVLSMQFSPDGERILTTNQDGESRLWNPDTGEPIGPIVRVMGSTVRPVFSPDARWAAVRIATGVTLLDGRTGIEVGRIPAGGKTVRFSPDGDRLATAGDDGSARVWDVPSGEPLTEPMRHRGGATLPAFSPDGSFLKTEDTHINIWAVPPALPEETPAPEWLLELATLCASQVVDDSGQLVPATEAVSRVERLRSEIAMLPFGSPLADWGRWVLDDRPDRPIAPGFTITPAEAARLAGTTGKAP